MMTLPTPLPILDARGRYLRAGLSFSRASAKRVFDARGTLVTVAANLPAWDCDPLTGAERGLLIEEARTNLLTYSEQFDNPAWTQTAATITSNAAASPDGTATADKLVEDMSPSSHLVRQDYTKAASAIAYTQTVFAKAAERSAVQIFVSSSSGNSGVYANYDLSKGSVATGPTLSGAFTGAMASIENVGNGWYRCRITFTTDTETLVRSRISLLSTPTGSTAYTGDGISGLYLWGAQLEAGHYPTSYVPTGASAVSRQADMAMLMVSGTAASPNTGTMAIDFLRVTGPGGTGEVAVLSNATGTHFHRLAMQPAGTLIASTRAAAVDTVGIPTAGSVVGTACKAAYAWQADGCAFAVGGALVGTSEAATMPASVDRLWLGHFNTGNMGQIWIREASLYPRRLANADLLAMTA